MLIIDPGHGGQDPGALGPKGLKEKDVVLAISQLLAKMLKESGVEVKLTREEDRAAQLQSRIALANTLKARLFLSIHCNSYTSSLAKGVEIWHSLKGDYGDIFHAEAKRTAAIIQQELVNGTGLSDRGIKTRLVEQKSSALYGLDYFAVIRQVKCPSLIIELGFINNPVEEALLGSPTFQEKASQSILRGLVKALDLLPLLKETTVLFENTKLKGFILDGRSYVEVRKLAEALGATVHWDPENNQVEIHR